MMIVTVSVPCINEPAGPLTFACEGNDTGFPSKTASETECGPAVNGTTWLMLQYWMPSSAADVIRRRDPFCSVTLSA